MTPGFPCGSAGKESACSVGDLGLIPGLGRSPGERNGYPLQYSGLENSMDCIVLGVTKSQTRLSNFHFHFFSLYSWASKVVQSKEFTCNVGGARDAGLIPGSGRSPGGGNGNPLQYSRASLVAQLVKNPPATHEAWVQSLGWEDPLEKGKASHSKILA